MVTATGARRRSATGRGDVLDAAVATASPCSTYAAEPEIRALSLLIPHSTPFPRALFGSVRCAPA